MSKFDPIGLPWWILKYVVGSKRGKEWIRSRLPTGLSAPFGEMPLLDPPRSFTPPRKVRPPKTGAPGAPRKPPRPQEPEKEKPWKPIPIEWNRSPSPEGRKRRRIIDESFSICKQSTIS